MNVTPILVKDYQDGMRSKLLWGLIALFIVSIGGFSLLASNGNAGSAQADRVVAAMGFAYIIAILFLVPVTGLVVSIKSITRERELGSIRILLSLPHSRAEVILGKFLGRSALLTTAILAGFVPAGIVLGLRLDGISMVDWSMLTLVTVLFGIAFVGVGIGVSALVKTETRATVAGLATFVLLFAWQWILNYVNSELDLLATDGNAYLFIQRFHLLNVFSDITAALQSLYTDGIPSASVVVPRRISAGSVTVDPQPFYLDHWFAFAILALWIIVPLAIGYWRFERTDL